ncbi:unnamed protein product [Caenorhabditis sp. 36 PRJEB53466]|nr:unnamed protein product [Caenorhabditis sp. 36 PRJEB53466]
MNAPEHNEQVFCCKLKTNVIFLLTAGTILPLFNLFAIIDRVRLPKTAPKDAERYFRTEFVSFILISIVSGSFLLVVFGCQLVQLPRPQRFWLKLLAPFVVVFTFLWFASNSLKLAEHGLIGTDDKEKADVLKYFTYGLIGREIFYFGSILSLFYLSAVMIKSSYLYTPPKPVILSSVQVNPPRSKEELKEPSGPENVPEAKKSASSSESSNSAKNSVKRDVVMAY